MSGTELLLSRARQALRNRGVRHQLRRCDRVGARPCVVGDAVIENLGRLEIGDDLLLRAAPVTSHLVTGPGGALVLGHRVRIGHGASVAAHGSVEVGDGASIGPYAIVMDTDFHTAKDHAAPGRPGRIVIGPGAQLGPRVTVLRGASIGAGARVMPGSVVNGVVPAGAVVTGIPARPATNQVVRGRRTVAEVVRDTLGLLSPPAPTTPREQIPGWDSLGALNVLLALEAEFQVSLSEGQVLAVRCVADLEREIGRAR